VTADFRGMAPLLQVFDMPRSIAFYRDVLGFAVVQTDRPGEARDWALLSLNGIELMLNTAYEEGARPPAPDPARVAAHGDTALYFGCPDVDAAYAQIRARGGAVRPPALTSYGFRALTLTDPDGYAVCFHWPATKQASEQWRARYGFDAKT
jgi:glyoxylase I family protein